MNEKTRGDRICILLRHGDYHQLRDTPSAHQPFPLNDAGVEQASEAIELVAEMARRNGWSLHPVVHCSTLLRAWQTADIVAAGLASCREILQTDRLTERGVGGGANLTQSQIAEIIANDPRYDALPSGWKSDSHFALPFVGAESMMTAGIRVADYVTETMNDLQPPDDRTEAVLFVGHGGSFRHAAHHLGALPFEKIAELSMYHARPVALAMSADGHCPHVDGQWKVRRPLEGSQD